LASAGEHSGLTPLAWMGWQLRVPHDWRPVRIDGEWRRGRMVVGSADAPVVRLRWWRPGARRFDAERWLRRRLRRLGLRPAAPRGPAPAACSYTAWAAEDELREEHRGLVRLWYGYAPAANLVLEAAVNVEAPRKARREVAARTLSSLIVYEQGKATRWAVFGASFESPAGFRILDKRLLLGDLCLRLRGEARSTLLLRQVYPAELALSRRKLERWIEVRPFRERRRYRPAVEPRPWQVESFGRRLEGIRRRGHKRLAFPLRFCAPRNTLSVVVRDTELDRLLIAEHDTPGEPDETLLGALVGRMNWARFEGGKGG